MAKPKQPVELPFASEAFKTAWEEWLEFRRENKYPTYARISVVKLFNRFKGWGESETLVAIDESIAQGWRGIFPPREGPPPTKAAIKPHVCQVPTPEDIKNDPQYGIGFDPE